MMTIYTLTYPQKYVTLKNNKASTKKVDLSPTFNPQSIWDNFVWEAPMTKRKRGKKGKTINLDPIITFQKGGKKTQTLFDKNNV